MLDKLRTTCHIYFGSVHGASTTVNGPAPVSEGIAALPTGRDADPARIAAYMVQVAGSSGHFCDLGRELQEACARTASRKGY